MYSILLIDDEYWEQRLVRDCCNQVFGSDCSVYHTKEVEKAVQRMANHTYDLILLDNLLADGMTARISVPFIKKHSGETPVVVISNVIEQEYLKRPSIVGADHIVAKDKLKMFLTLYMQTH